MSRRGRPHKLFIIFFGVDEDLGEWEEAWLGCGRDSEEGLQREYVRVRFRE